MNGLTDFIKKQLSELQEMKVFETRDIRVFSLNGGEDFTLRETYTVTKVPGLYFFHCSNGNADFNVTEKELHAAIGYHLATVDKGNGKSEVKI